jgi:hypothetical protein
VSHDDSPRRVVQRWSERRCWVTVSLPLPREHAERRAVDEARRQGRSLDMFRIVPFTVGAS